MPAWNSATRIEIVEQKHSKKSTLHTGHICLLGLVSSHWVECFTQCEYNCVNVDGSRNSTNVEVFSTWCKQGQQKRCPHMDTTASLAVSRHMLHCRDIKIDEARKDWIHIWYDPIAKGLPQKLCPPHHHPAFPPFALPLIRTRLLPTLVDQRLPQPSCQSEIKYCSRAYFSSSNTRLLMKLMKSADNIITGIVCLLVHFWIPIIIMDAVRAEMKYINVICPW